MKLLSSSHNHESAIRENAFPSLESQVACLELLSHR